MSRFTVTYDVVTPESAEDGDVADAGFILPGNWKVNSESNDSVTMTLREALALARPDCDCGSWWSESDGETNYQTGAVETRSIHPPRNITPSSYCRVTRLLRTR